MSERTSRTFREMVGAVLSAAVIVVVASCASSDGPKESVGVSASALTAADVTGFESTSGWTLSSGAATLTTNRTQGSVAFSLVPNGWLQLTSVPLSSLSGVTGTLGLDVAMPSKAPNPSWLGTLQLAVNCPSHGLFNVQIGQTDLSTLPLGKFGSVQYAVPATIASALAGTYTDLQFYVVINVPSSTTAAYLLDNLHFAGTPADAGTDASQDATADVTRDATADAGRDASDGGGHSDQYGPCLETPKTSNVLVIVYDPYHLARHQDQATHGRAVVDPVIASHQLVEIFRQTSHGLLNYKITEVRFVNGEPPQLASPMPGNTADYGAVFTLNNICSLVQNNNLSEVWIWGDNTSGFDELAYKVPNDAMPNDSQAESPWFYDLRKKNIPDCGKTVWAMAWNYDVGIDNALHSYDHRIESIVSLLVGQGHWLTTGDLQNPWHKFSLYDHDFPGQAGVGTTHFPANAGLAYDYTNMTAVPSTALDFQSYPALTGAKTSINCAAWGCTQVGYQEWYEGLIPHVAGTSYAGTCNSWWTYIADFDRRLAACSGSSCLQSNGAACAQDDECASGNCKCGACAAAGSNPSCSGAAFETCSAASQCATGVCGCTTETGTKECLPSSSYLSACPQPTGGYCWADGDCASSTCGCNGGASVSCLSSGQIRTCNNVPNWSLCLRNADCLSGVCGCFGNLMPMQCLPNTGYLSTCP